MTQMMTLVSKIPLKHMGKGENAGFYLRVFRSLLPMGRQS